MKPFTEEQKLYITLGGGLARTLRLRVEEALKVTQHLIEVKRHTYIMSPPGVGKTFTVQAVANDNGVDLVKIQGVATMSAVVIKLAVAVHSLESGDHAVVWIDDCDNLFMDAASLSVMKGVLDEDRNILAYHKNLTNQLAQFERSDNPLDRHKAEALRAFQIPGSVGVEIPTDQLRFIVTSNKPLTAPNAVLSTPRKMDEAAIRDRVNYVEFSDVGGKKNWGWIASVVLNGDVLDLNVEQKHLLLDFMYTHWARLPSTSMRKVKDLAALMFNHPHEYPDHWEAELHSGSVGS